MHSRHPQRHQLAFTILVTHRTTTIQPRLDHRFAFQTQKKKREKKEIQHTLTQTFPFQKMEQKTHKAILPLNPLPAPTPPPKAGKVDENGINDDNGTRSAPLKHEACTTCRHRKSIVNPCGVSCNSRVHR
jgi:hypothetical protein